MYPSPPSLPLEKRGEMMRITGTIARRQPSGVIDDPAGKTGSPSMVMWLEALVSVCYSLLDANLLL
jgi:hypothetical protein